MPSEYVIDVYAPWCAPCKVVEGILNDLEDHYRIHVVKINVDEDPTVIREYGVRSVPTLLRVADGTVIDKKTSDFSRDAIVSWLGLTP